MTPFPLASRIPGACILLALACGPASAAEITVGWSDVQRVSVTTPTLQVVSNPLLVRGKAPHDSAYAELRRLHANTVRYVPWFPYPELGVPERTAPANGKTSWDFSQIDPLVEDLLSAQEGRSVIMNFSTIPDWVLADTSYGLLGDYYGRILSWYEKGGFTDEYGVVHSSNHHYKFAYWEAFNEPDLEGKVRASEYCKRYDALVTAMRKIDPDLKFGGPGLASMNDDFMRYFLDPAHHKAGIPIDLITFHRYLGRNGTAFTTQSNTLTEWIWRHNALRDRYRPGAVTDLDELGMFGPESGFALNDPFWNFSGATFAFLFAQMRLAGTEYAGMSQLMAQPGNFPDVSMLDWNTGVANARARVLELLIRHCGPGDTVVAARSSDSSVFAQAFIDGQGRRKLLVVNQNPGNITVTFPQAVAAAEYVDTATASGPVAALSQAGGRQYVLGGYAVWIATLAPVAVPTGNAVTQVSDGSFETRRLAAHGFAYRCAGTGWDFRAGAGLSADSSALTSANPKAPDGSQVLFLQQYAVAEQFLNLEPGQYSLSLQAAQRGGTQASAQSLEIRVDGKRIAAFTPASTRYEGFTTPVFTVAAGRHRLSLEGAPDDASDKTVFIDAVSLKRLSTRIALRPAGARKALAPQVDASGRQTGGSAAARALFRPHR